MNNPTWKKKKKTSGHRQFPEERGGGERADRQYGEMISFHEELSVESWRGVENEKKGSVSHF